MARPLNSPVLAPPDDEGLGAAALDVVEDGWADHSADDDEDAADDAEDAADHEEDAADHEEDVGTAAAWTAALGAPSPEDEVAEAHADS